MSPDREQPGFGEEGGRSEEGSGAGRGRPSSSGDDGTASGESPQTIRQRSPAVLSPPGSPAFPPSVSQLPRSPTSPLAKPSHSDQSQSSTQQRQISSHHFPTEPSHGMQTGHGSDGRISETAGTTSSRSGHSGEELRVGTDDAFSSGRRDEDEERSGASQGELASQMESASQMEPDGTRSSLPSQTDSSSSYQTPDSGPRYSEPELRRPTGAEDSDSVEEGRGSTSQANDSAFQSPSHPLLHISKDSLAWTQSRQESITSQEEFEALERQLSEDSLGRASDHSHGSRPSAIVKPLGVETGQLSAAQADAYRRRSPRPDDDLVRVVQRPGRGQADTRPVVRAGASPGHFPDPFSGPAIPRTPASRPSRLKPDEASPQAQPPSYSTKGGGSTGGSGSGAGGGQADSRQVVRVNPDPFTGPGIPRTPASRPSRLKPDEDSGQAQTPSYSTKGGSGVGGSASPERALRQRSSTPERRAATLSPVRSPTRKKVVPTKPMPQLPSAQQLLQQAAEHQHQQGTLTAEEKLVLQSAAGVGSGSAEESGALYRDLDNRGVAVGRGWETGQFERMFEPADETAGGFTRFGRSSGRSDRSSGGKSSSSTRPWLTSQLPIADTSHLPPPRPAKRTAPASPIVARLKQPPATKHISPAKDNPAAKSPKSSPG